jgi:hypothetical protein
MDETKQRYKCNITNFFQINIGRELLIGLIALEDFVLRLISPQRVSFRLEMDHRSLGENK